MKYRIELAPEAREQFHDLSAYDRSKVRNAIDSHLTNNPTLESKSRIKRLRELKRPQYRLRVDDIRIFYDVEGQMVSVLGMTTKSQAEKWLQSAGEKL